MYMIIQENDINYINHIIKENDNITDFVKEKGITKKILEYQQLFEYQEFIESYNNNWNEISKNLHKLHILRIRQIFNNSNWGKRKRFNPEIYLDYSTNFLKLYKYNIQWDLIDYSQLYINRRIKDELSYKINGRIIKWLY